MTTYQFFGVENVQAKMLFYFQLEIRSVERGICPTATLYSLAAAYKGGRCKQGAIIFHCYRCLSQTNSILLFGPRITVQNFIEIESKLRP